MILDIAKKYVASGFSVMPIKKGGKIPVLSQWKFLQERLPTEQELEEWFSKDVNIAIITGRISKLSVVDVDIAHGGSAAGLPPTLTARTQAGGWHFYYQYMEGLPNKAGVRQGVDIRSDGGYVVAPPSKGEKGDYEWVISEEPQPFPADILKINVQKTEVDWNKVAEGITEGTRNEMAAKYIGKLLQMSHDSSFVWQTILYWNKSNTPPLPEGELRAVFNSILSREIKKQDDDAPVVLMSEAAKKISDDLSTPYPTGFHALDESLKGGLREGNLVLVVGETGMGKTTLARSLTCNLLDGLATSVWFTFEMSVAEMWEKFEEMGMDDQSMIYTPEKNITRKLDWLKKKIVEAREKYKCKAVFIDHLGFLVGEYTPDTQISGVSHNLSTVYSMICRDLKTMAVQENVVIVLMWHLRKLAQGQTEAGMSDVKDSAGVLQECDLGLSVSRTSTRSNRANFADIPVSDVYDGPTLVKTLKNRRTGILKRFQCDFENGRLLEAESVADVREAEAEYDSF